MSFTIKTKVKVPSEKDTRIKFLSLAQQIGCTGEVKKLFKKYDGFAQQYVNDSIAREKIAGNMIQELSNIDLQLVAWLFNDDNEILVNNKVVLKLIDDGK